MSSLGVTLSAQLSRHLFSAIGDVEARERALEHGQRGFGLVEGDFVAGFVDAEEADCERFVSLLFSRGQGCPG